MKINDIRLDDELAEKYLAVFSQQNLENLTDIRAIRDLIYRLEDIEFSNRIKPIVKEYEELFLLMLASISVDYRFELENNTYSFYLEIEGLKDDVKVGETADEVINETKEVLLEELLKVAINKEEKELSGESREKFVTKKIKKLKTNYRFI